MSVLSRDSNGQTTLCMSPGVSHTLAFTGTSAQSAALGAQCEIVRLVASQPCFIVVGADPVATAAGMFLPAGSVEYIAVDPGQKIAAIQASGAGTLYITEAA